MRARFASLQRPTMAPVLGAGLGAAAAAAYLVGGGRSFEIDEAITFANFVATDSLWAVLGGRTAVELSARSVTGTTDHVLVSLLSHLIYVVSGTHSELAYRVLPAVAAGAAVAVVCWFLVSRFGLAAGATAAVFMASTEAWVFQSRQMRGYSLMVLLVVIASLVLRPRPATPKRAAVYGALMTAAIAAHLYALFLLPVHLAFVFAGRRDDLRRIVVAAVTAGALGLLCNALVLVNTLQVLSGTSQRQFHPDFPKVLAVDLLGGPSPIAAALGLSAVGLGVFAVRRRRWFRYSAAAFAAVVAFTWLVLQPAWLYPRLFMFALPGLAYLVAAALHRWRLLVPIVLLGAAASVALQVPGYTSEPTSLPVAARIIDGASAAGGRPCVLDGDQVETLAYTHRFVVVTDSRQLAHCDLVLITAWAADPRLEEAAVSRFPRQRVLPGRTTGLLLTGP